MGKNGFRKRKPGGSKPDQEQKKRLKPSPPSGNGNDVDQPEEECTLFNFNLPATFLGDILSGIKSKIPESIDPAYKTGVAILDVICCKCCPSSKRKMKDDDKDEDSPTMQDLVEDLSNEKKRTMTWKPN